MHCWAGKSGIWALIENHRNSISFLCMNPQYKQVENMGHHKAPVEHNYMADYYLNGGDSDTDFSIMKALVIFLFHRCKEKDFHFLPYVSHLKWMLET